MYTIKEYIIRIQDQKYTKCIRYIYLKNLFMILVTAISVIFITRSMYSVCETYINTFHIRSFI